MPSGRTLMFAGFRSRWMIPCSCAASSASAICFAMGSASSTGTAPRAIRCDSRRPRPAPSRGRSRLRSLRARRSPRCWDGSATRAFWLRAETRQSVGVGRESFGQHLDRDVAIQLRVARPIDLAHAAFADRRGDFVDAEAGAEGEGQRWGLYGRSDSADGITPRKRRSVYRCRGPAPQRPLKQPHGRDFGRRTGTMASASGRFSRSCATTASKISAHPSERKASWMSARSSRYRTRRRRH